MKTSEHLKYPLVLTTLLVTLPVSCGDDDDSDPAPVITYATLQVDSTTTTEDGSYPLTRQTTCTFDNTTGLVEIMFTGKDNSALTVKIKGFQTNVTSYTCTQASDNTTGEVGGAYDGCAVEFSIGDGDSGFNTYAMHRSSASIQDFTYSQDNTCTLTTTYDERRIEGTISCANMPQTVLNGTARNPIDTATSATLSATTDFGCNSTQPN